MDESVVETGVIGQDVVVSGQGQKLLRRMDKMAWSSISSLLKDCKEEGCISPQRTNEC